MEKKGNRSVQPSSKGLGTDKKSLDGNVSKPWPRGGRRREPNGGSFPAKSENVRKPTPQRNKSFDIKRPRARGNYYQNYNADAVAGNENAGLEEGNDAELGSVFVQGSKKQSLNHLLNFHYAPYERNSGRAGNAKLGNRWIAPNKHKYNKEQFLQANCQFIVKDSGNYKQYINNPDALVEWSLIEQVNVQVSEFPSCPICLYPPVAAKMTHCGHIYCWSCMLHYLALSDKSSRKCPICYENVHKEDLKSVIAVAHNFFNVNDQITFKLMKRAKGSLIAYPADQHVDGDETLFQVSNTLASNIYCKLLLATKSDVIKIIERENVELECQLVQDENAPERCFIEEAMSLLNVRKNVLFDNEQASGVGIKVDNVPPSNSGCELHNDDIFEFQEDNWKRLEKLKLGTPREHLDSACSDDVSSISNEDVDFAHAQNRSKAIAKMYYFYQASDGQHIYLHALNVRMLEHTHGSLEYCPLTLTSKILEKETNSMTEEVRKRMRCLQHLPVTCQFEVAEIQLNESVVAKETLVEFHDQIEGRKKRRLKRARDEKRREKLIAEEENRMMGKYPEARIHIESHSQFPDFDGTGFEAALGEEVETNSSPLSSAAGSLENDHHALSFAKMLSSSSQKKATPSWPQLKKEEAPPKLINVTGSRSNPAIAAKVGRSKGSDSEPETEGYVPVPAFSRSFSDSIAAAFEKATNLDEADEPGEVQSGKKKKKKNKKKILFATSMTYGNN